MKLFKKARELFDRLTHKSDTPPPVRPPPTVEAEVVLDPAHKYRRAQRDLERLAKATALFWNSAPAPHGRGTYSVGRNAAVREERANLVASGVSPRVAKRKARNYVTVSA